MREGGKYSVNKDGNAKLLERTEPGPAGQGPRDAEGNRLDDQGRTTKPKKADLKVVQNDNKKTGKTGAKNDSDNQGESK